MQGVCCRAGYRQASPAAYGLSRPPDHYPKVYAETNRYDIQYDLAGWERGVSAALILAVKGWEPPLSAVTDDAVLVKDVPKCGVCLKYGKMNAPRHGTLR